MTGSRLLPMLSLLLAAALVAIAPPVLADDGKPFGSIARGGRLYDNWMSVLKADKPDRIHPSWPASNTPKSPDITWRCKNCHGWDQLGKDGAYATGTYKTGIGGIRGQASVDPAKVIEILNAPSHGFGTLLRPQDLADLAAFVTQGQTDYEAIVERASKTFKGGKLGAGKAYYETMCVGCHGADGRLPDEMPEALARLAASNPWETAHKVIYGQPGEPMPAMVALDRQILADVLVYIATLPKDKAPKPAEPAKQ